MSFTLGGPTPPSSLLTMNSLLAKTESGMVIEVSETPEQTRIVVNQPNGDELWFVSFTGGVAPKVEVSSPNDEYEAKQSI
ncbi:MAG: hypothetical protein EBZ48_15005 [Proteobacteria bacterium]|nr:hypothetical protein [Pseudomonadota bacterium]